VLEAAHHRGGTPAVEEGSLVAVEDTRDSPEEAAAVHYLAGDSIAAAAGVDNLLAGEADIHVAAGTAEEADPRREEDSTAVGRLVVVVGS